MLDFVLSLLGQLLGAEFGAKCPQIADKLIANAVQKLPASLQERMYEEWCAVLNDTPGDLSKLAVAISLYWILLGIKLRKIHMRELLQIMVSSTIAISLLILKT